MQTLKQQNSDFVVFEFFFYHDIYTAFLSTFIWKEFPQEKKLSEENFLIYYQINLNLLSYGTCTNHNIRLE